jgi:RNA polymerase sigma-70 factor (ECF subfamily)
MCTPNERDPVTQKAGFGLGRSDAAAINEYMDDDAAPATRREWRRASGRPLAIAEWELAQIELAKKDPAAFAPLYEAYADLVWRYAVKRVGDEERAADATSQVFIKVIAALPKYKPAMRGEHTTFRSWLMLIARNVVIDEVRKHRPTTDLAATSAQPWLVDRARSPEESAIASEESARVRRAVAKLPAKQRRIVELRASGLKGGEIAEVLGMSLAGVRTANHRAYVRLRELLGDQNRDDDEGTRS